MSKTFFIITVDTEADNQWQRPSTESVRNISFLPRFQLLCEKYSLPVTYLITYEVATDQSAINILKSFKDRGAEIGAHLHPWTTPPFSKSRDEDRRWHQFPSELTKEEFRSKLLTLTQEIEKNFGHPTSYRSGRWGFDESLVSELVAQNYLVDCSVTPKLSWRETRGGSETKTGPDFRRAKLRPHYFGRLFEVPLTVIATSSLVRESGALISLYNALNNGLLKRLLNKVFLRVKTLRIFPETTVNDLRSIIRAVKRNHLPVAEFMIHSSELMPGGSPYAKTIEAVERSYELLEELFKLAKSEGLVGITLSDYARLKMETEKND